MKRVHLIGVGGIGMSGLAQALLSRGISVSGSDPSRNAATQRLLDNGAVIYTDQVAENIRLQNPDVVVYTAAIPDSNEELREARALGIETVSRAAFLGSLMADYEGPTIAVAGTHGKTTTTAMIAEVLIAGLLDPTVLIGGEYAPIGGNARIGAGSVFLAEACEAYDSFLELRPSITVLTNVEADHLDHYGTEDAVFASFRKFVLQTSGTLIWCAEDSGAQRMLHYELQMDEGPSRISYGFSPYSDSSVWAEDIVDESTGSAYTLRYSRDRETIADSIRIALRQPGRHFLLNSLAAAAAGLAVGLSLGSIQQGLGRFVGTSRRFESLGERDGVSVIDDYAHHPTEIRATLSAARTAFPGRRLIAVFQPHLYSRTRDFMVEFAQALGEADAIILTDIYPAREAPIPGVDIADLVRKVSEVAPLRTLLYIPRVAEIPAAIQWLCRPGDVVISMGAGDIREAAEMYVRERGAAA